MFARPVASWILAALLASALLGNLAVVYQHGHLRAAIRGLKSMENDRPFYEAEWTIGAVKHRVVTFKRDGWTDAQWAAAHAAAIAAHPFPPPTGD